MRTRTDAPSVPCLLLKQPLNFGCLSLLTYSLKVMELNTLSIK
jgi:hypothetical protein